MKNSGTSGMRSHLNQKQCQKGKKDGKQPTLDFSGSMVSYGLPLQRVILTTMILTTSDSNDSYDSDDSYDPGDAMDSDDTYDWNNNHANRCANVLCQVTAPRNLTAKKFSISKC